MLVSEAIQYREFISIIICILVTRGDSLVPTSGMKTVLRYIKTTEIVEGLNICLNTVGKTVNRE